MNNTKKNLNLTEKILDLNNLNIELSTRNMRSLRNSKNINLEIEENHKIEKNLNINIFDGIKIQSPEKSKSSSPCSLRSKSSTDKSRKNSGNSFLILYLKN